MDRRRGLWILALLVASWLAPAPARGQPNSALDARFAKISAQFDF